MSILFMLFVYHIHVLYKNKNYNVLYIILYCALEVIKYCILLVYLYHLNRNKREKF